MGITYKAMDVNLRVPVALKVINTRYSRQDSARQRFLGEARSAARLRHPNVASVFHFGSITRTSAVQATHTEAIDLGEETECFYTMEFVEGETLEERLRRTGPLDPLLTLQIALQVSRALAEAEKRGLVHRDLKPANIMLTGDGEFRGRHRTTMGEAWVKVIDFGLAKAVGTAAEAHFGDAPVNPEPPLTRPGFLGTPQFASPEQFAGGKNIDARSDIFSLGVVLWYLLTGDLPFKGDSLAEIRASQLQSPLPLVQLRTCRTPARLIRLLTAMLETEPAHRPASGFALHEALEDCLATVQAHPRSSRVGLFLPASRQGRMALAAVTATLLLAGSGAGYALMRSRVHAPGAQSTREVFPVVAENSVAVLPFENSSPDKENLFFGEGVQEELITNLSKVAALKVTPPSSVHGYSGHPLGDPREIGRRLAVAHLVEGSVRRTDKRVQISVRLIDARTGTQQWAEHYERDLADVSGIQGEIALTVTAKLQATLSPSEHAAVEEAPTRDLAAYDAYRLGRKRLAAAERIYDDRGIFDAISLLEEATTRDPQLYQAWCELCRAHLSLCFFNLDNTPERLAQAEHAAQMVHRLRPDDGETHIIEGLRLERGYLNYPAAITELQTAARLMPHSPDPPYWLALLYADMGRTAEAAPEMERAANLDPHNAELWLRAAKLNHRANQYRKANEAIDRALLEDPTDLDCSLLKADFAWGDLADMEPMRKWLRDLPPDSERWRDKAALFSTWIALQSRDYAGAARAMARYRPKTYTSGGGCVYPREEMEGWIALLAGDRARAEALLPTARQSASEAVAQHPNEALALNTVARIDAKLGRKEDALREGDEALAIQTAHDDSPYARASLLGKLTVSYALVGESDRAFQTIEALSHEKERFFTYGDLKLDPVYDRLRGDPRFKRVLASFAPKSEGVVKP